MYWRATWSIEVQAEGGGLEQVVREGGGDRALPSPAGRCPLVQRSEVTGHGISFRGLEATVAREVGITPLFPSDVSFLSEAGGHKGGFGGCQAVLSTVPRHGQGTSFPGCRNCCLLSLNCLLPRHGPQQGLSHPR